VVENLAVKNMVKNHNLAKSISDAGWGMFCTMLKYKAEAEGKVYLEVGRFFPSSHLCSNTLLSLPKMDLSVREFTCPHCGQKHDRDINAATNIRNEGLRILALGTRVTAFGGNVRPKQYGRKSTAVEAVALELGSPLSTRSGESWVVHDCGLDHLKGRSRLSGSHRANPNLQSDLISLGKWNSALG
jgi:putative transposase